MPADNQDMSHCAKPCSTRTCLAQALTWQGTPSLCAFLGFMALMNGIIAAFFASASSFMYAKEGDPATAEDFVFLVRPVLAPCGHSAFGNPGPGHDQQLAHPWPIRRCHRPCDERLRLRPLDDCLVAVRGELTGRGQTWQGHFLGSLVKWQTVHASRGPEGPLANFLERIGGTPMPRRPHTPMSREPYAPTGADFLLLPATLAGLAASGYLKFGPSNQFESSRPLRLLWAPRAYTAPARSGNVTVASP